MSQCHRSKMNTIHNKYNSLSDQWTPTKKNIGWSITSVSDDEVKHKKYDSFLLTLGHRHKLLVKKKEISDCFFFWGKGGGVCVCSSLHDNLQKYSVVYHM